MQTALKITTRILPGKRIEFTSPDLPEHGEVELTVVYSDDAEQRPEFASAWEFLQSLPQVEHTAEDWERKEREFRAERDSWGD